MSAPRNAIIWLVLWLLWTILAYPMCLDDCCGGIATGDEEVGLVEDRDDQAPPAAADTTAPAATRSAIDFQWSAAQPNVNDGFESLKNRIQSQMTDDNVLEITGRYFEGENTPEGYENLGLARAESARQLIVPDLDAERINLRSRLVEPPEGAREGYFDALDFEWIQPEEKAAATVEELDDRQIVRFPFNSVVKEVNPEIDEYLDKLATRIKQTGEQVRLVGHTDNVGSPEANMTLSDRRAKEIRDILISKGVPRAQIITEAKGETQPVASNETEEGRQDNRRVEIFLLTNN